MAVRKRKPTKKQAAERAKLFLAAIGNYLIGPAQATLVRSRSEDEPVPMREFLVLTQAGTLEVTVFSNWIACRFQDVPHARHWLLAHHEGGNLNPHSGKWNFHFDEDTDVVAARETFRAALEPLLYPSRPTIKVT